MNNAILVGTVSVLFVTASCGTREDPTASQRSASEPSSSGPGHAGAQPVVDPDCNDGLIPPYDTLPLVSATYIGEADGTLDLGNGQSATLHFRPISPNNSFPAFAWSATTPIVTIKFTYLVNRRNDYPNIPPSTSGQTYYIPTNGPITFLPADEVTTKFCYSATPTPPLDAGSGGERHDAGGLDSGGGKTW